jgi:hypothetical protein
MTSPLLDDHLRLGSAAEPFEAQALVAEFAIEAFPNPILPRLARLDQRIPTVYTALSFGGLRD